MIWIKKQNVKRVSFVEKTHNSAHCLRNVKLKEWVFFIVIQIFFWNPVKILASQWNILGLPIYLMKAKIIPRRRVFYELLNFHATQIGQATAK